jgi:predicted nucleic acid-binding Zn ribbon protein
MPDSPDSGRKYPFTPSRFKKRKRTGPGPFNPSRVSSVIEKTSSLSSIGAKITEYKVKKAWAGVVGATIDKRARPARLIGKTLHCTVSTGPWMTELNFQKGALMDGLNEALGTKAVTNIVFKLGALEVRPEGAQKGARRRVKEPSAEERRFVEETVSVVHDPELKSIIKRALLKSKT